MIKVINILRMSVWHCAHTSLSNCFDLNLAGTFAGKYVYGNMIFLQIIQHSLDLDFEFIKLKMPFTMHLGKFNRIKIGTEIWKTYFDLVNNTITIRMNLKKSELKGNHLNL